MGETPEARRTWAIDTCITLAVCVLLVAPLFRLKYLDSWGSIESTFISDGRFLREHWPHPRWQPLWYCGTRFDYIYPPALRYGTAAISMALGVIPAKGYHIYIALLYCIGIAGVYWLARVGSRSRGCAWFAAAATATISPCFIFIRDMRHDVASHHFIPQRLNVLMRYGEGPHMSALALLPLALAASLVALRGRRPAMLAAAGCLAATVVSNNFYGATALVIFYPILVWAVWLADRDPRMWRRALAIPALAYGLTAFWLSPSYLRITGENMRLVSQPGNWWSLVLAIVLALGFGAWSWRYARDPGERRARLWTIFIVGAFLAFTVNVLGNEYFNFRVVGEPSRLAPEMDLVMILVGTEILRRIWAASRPVATVFGALVLAAGIPYLTHPWSPYVRANAFENRIEYRMTKWIADHLPGARVLSTGSLRFWYDAWFDLPQIGGGSEQGVLNQTVAAAQWDIMLGDKPETAILWMQALGADAVAVHEKRSQEIYHDFPNPAKFAGVLPVIYDSGQGDTIYRVPRRFPSLARVVSNAEVARLQPVPSTFTYEPALRAYVDAVELNAGEAWLGFDTPDSARLRATLQPGQSVLVQENYDPAWRAYAGSSPLPVRRDAMGFMLIDAPPGQQEIRLVFDTPVENRVGQGLTAVAAVLVALLFAGRFRRAI